MLPVAWLTTCVVFSISLGVSYCWSLCAYVFIIAIGGDGCKTAASYLLCSSLEAFELVGVLCGCQSAYGGDDRDDRHAVLMPVSDADLAACAVLSTPLESTAANFWVFCRLRCWHTCWEVALHLSGCR